MTRHKGLAVGGILAGVLIMAGCAKTPQADIDAAKAALEAARKAEAQVYVAQGFASAEKAYNDAMAEVAKQDSAFALSRNYAQAQKLLAAATQQAKELVQAAANAKAALKTEVEGLAASVKTAIEGAKQAIAKAPKSRKALVDGLKKELAEAEAALTAAQGQIASGAYATAKDALNATQGQVQAIMGKLQAK